MREKNGFGQTVLFFLFAGLYQLFLLKSIFDKFILQDPGTGFRLDLFLFLKFEFNLAADNLYL